MPFRVIVADPSSAAVRAVELALPAPEFLVRSFHDGLDAIEAVREIPPDAVLSAFGLPSRDGYELGSFVRSQTSGSQIALFFLRGAFEPFDMPRISQVAYDGIILKPFDGDSLAHLVRETIGQKRELPCLPEEPAIDRTSSQPSSPPESLSAAFPPASPDLDARIRAIVQAELRGRDSEIRKIAADIVSDEVKRVLVEELKKIDTRKI
jgi:DNA-binding response OmpR family regulator